MDVPEKQRKELRHIMDWLKMDPDELNASYDVTVQSKSDFHLKAKASDAIFSQIDLKMGGNGFVERLDLEEISGDRLSFQFGTPKVKYQ